MFPGIFWLLWLWQKRTWPVWVRVGLTPAPLALLVTVALLIPSTAPQADARAPGQATRPAAKTQPDKPANQKANTPPTRPAKAAASERELTGFGATRPAWDAHHTADTRFEPGAAYEPDPSLARGNDRVEDRYYGVLNDGATVTSYNMRFPRQTGIREAKLIVLASEFPPDAKIAWFRTLDTCAQMLVYSKRVARAGTEAALFEFTTGVAADKYNPRDVWDAIVLPWPLSGPGQGPGC